MAKGSYYDKDAADYAVSFIVVGAFRHETGWLVFLQLSDCGHLLK